MKNKYTDLRDKLARHKYKKPTVRPFSSIHYIVVHCTDMVVTPHSLARYDVGPNHISKTGCPGITYADIIDMDGHIYHCEYYKNVTWHAGKWNKKSVGVALNYKATNKKGKPDFRPSRESLDSLHHLLVSMCLVLKVNPKNIVGHRELKDTGWVWKISKDSGKARKSQLKWCPGQFVDLELIRNKAARMVQIRLKIDGYYKGGIDGIFGPKSIRALEQWVPKDKR